MCKPKPSNNRDLKKRSNLKGEVGLVALLPLFSMKGGSFMGKIDWDVVTNFTDAVTTTLKTVTFPKVQEQVYLRNQGNANFTYTIGSQSGTLTPGQSVTVNQDVSSFTLQAVSGTHTFEVRAKEKGTEINETDNNLPSNIAEQLNTLSSSMAQKAAKSDFDAIPQQSFLYSKLRSYKRKLPFPTGWTWTTAPINIYKLGTGEITTDFDVSKFQYVGAGKTYYVNIATGHNTNNDGLSEGAPLKSIWAAVNKTDVDVIIIADGYYDRANGFAGFNVTRSMSIKAKNKGMVTASISDSNLTWTKTTGMTNVYQVSRTATALIYDRKKIDEYGDYIKLTKKNSIAEVDANQGSWYTDGTIVYVNTSDSRSPDVDVRVFLDLPHVVMSGNANQLYMEGINLEGGKESINTESCLSPSTAGFYAKDCTFKYTNGSNIYRTWGISKVYSQNCVAAQGRLDGFNYHVLNNVVPDVIEVNCIGRHNGLDDTSNSNNGSTMHDGGRIIRVNCEYHHNTGPNMIDVNESTQSWAVGISSHESLATAGTVSNTDYKVSNVGASKMWLDSCISFGSDYSLVVDGTNSIAYVSNILFLKGDNIIGTGNSKQSYVS
jgi:hypothetical protein